MGIRLCNLEVIGIFDFNCCPVCCTKSMINDKFHAKHTDNILSAMHYFAGIVGNIALSWLINGHLYTGNYLEFEHVFLLCWATS